MKNISIIGSTGSIGTSTLDVVKRNPERFRICGLAAKSNLALLEAQIRDFQPETASLDDPELAEQLSENVKDLPVNIYSGVEGAVKVATLPDAEMVVSAAVGIAGLIPTFSALEGGKTVALANKEVLVAGGELIKRKFGDSKRILPLDSEHNAIFQLLEGEKKSNLRKIILTASGGPFLKWKMEDLAKVGPQEALCHPNWTMGPKITIDSATLINKGFEVIEAKWLFDATFDEIEVLIHPQSIIHSLVEFVDGSVKALLSLPDMRLPIAYALDYPDRVDSTFSRLDLAKIGQLSFEKPDLHRFPGLELCYYALKIGGTMPVVLNASNELMVQAFLDKRISFLQISEFIRVIMEKHAVKPILFLEDILWADNWARQETEELLNQRQGRAKRTKNQEPGTKT